MVRASAARPSVADVSLDSSEGSMDAFAPGSYSACFGSFGFVSKTTNDSLFGRAHGYWLDCRSREIALPWCRGHRLGLRRLHLPHRKPFASCSSIKPSHTRTRAGDR